VKNGVIVVVILSGYQAWTPVRSSSTHLTYPSLGVVESSACYPVHPGLSSPEPRCQHRLQENTRCHHSGNRNLRQYQLDDSQSHCTQHTELIMLPC
jgi:hypothetical protein